ncbi:MAG: hypothetical protein ABI564_14190 [Ideonella sp.]
MALFLKMFGERNIWRSPLRASWLAALCAIGASSPALAIDFGTLRLYMPPGQPAYAEITLTDKAPLDPADIRARIATKDAYGVAGMRYVPALQQVSITPQSGPSGQVVLRLERLPDASVAPDIDLLLLVGDRMSLSLGEYRVDLNGSSREFAAAPAGSRITANAPPAAAATPAAPSTAATTAAVVSGSANSVATVPVARPASPAAFSEVQSALEAWASAWSQRDIDAYVAAYTPDFAGRGKGSHSDWVEQRRSRIVPKKKISVEIDKPQFVARGDKIVATFTQRYRGDGLAETSRKRMLMVRGTSGGWLIQEEDELP